MLSPQKEQVWFEHEHEMLTSFFIPPSISLIKSAFDDVLPYMHKL